MCAQLYVQKNAQPDTWVMSGAPTATTVFLSLAATINYSDGTSDTLPANTLAVLPDTTTVFDRTHDVYVCYTVQTSGVLSVIKESLLPTLTSAYAPLCRIELHGIKPYQPEPYLAAGGVGATGAPTTTTVGSAAGQGRAHDLGAGGTPPSGWETRAYDDSAWTAPVAETAGTFGAPEAGSAWVTYADGSRPASDVWLVRHAFGLPAGTVQSASVAVNADDYIEDVYVNGTAITTTEFHCPPVQTYSVPATLLVCAGGAASNVLAIRVKNGTASSDNPTSVDYVLSATISPAVGGADEGSLLSFHDGAWSNLPIGTSGQELTVVSGDPAWATPAASGVTSVAVAAPSPLASSGGPITSSGTITLAWASGQTANRVLASPDGTTGAVSLRALVGNDLPVDASTIVSSAGVIKGNYQAGSGVSISGNTISATGSGGSVTSVALSAPALFSVAGSPITGAGTLALSYAAGQYLPAAQGGTGVDASAAANGKLLIGNGSGLTLATLTAGSGVTITNAAGAITLASTGGGAAPVAGMARLPSDTSTNSTSYVDVDATNQAVTITSTGKPVLITWSGGAKSSSSGVDAQFTLNIDGSDVGEGVLLQTRDTNDSWHGFTYMHTPAAGSHTYKLRYKVSSSATATVRPSQISTVLIVREVH